MAYCLEALIGKDTLVTVPQIYPTAQLVWLHHGLQMIPITSALRGELLAHASKEQTLRWKEEIQARGLSSGFGNDIGGIADLASQLSEIGPVAYVEAEFFAGEGGQSALVWQRGQITLAVGYYGVGAVNQALRSLGVRANHSESGFDEFLMVGLGRKRDTERWGEIVAQQQAIGALEWETERLSAALAGAENALSELHPESPVYQIAEQQKKWAVQQLEALRRKTGDEGNII